MFKAGRHINRPYQLRININVPGLTKISMDIKYMPPSSTQHRFILVMLCEVTNYVVAMPMRTTKTPEVCKNILNGFIKYYGTPSHIVCDRDPSFLSSLAQYFFSQFKIKLLTVSVTNHQSLLAEHGIKSLSGILMKHLSGLGRDWPEFVGASMLTHNAFATPNLGGFSPYELVFGRRAKIVPELEIVPEVPVTGTFKNYHAKLVKLLHYKHSFVHKFREQRIQLMNRGKDPSSFFAGQLVYTFEPAGAMLITGSRKIKCEWCGPLVVIMPVAPNQFILMSLDGKIYPRFIEETRLKQGWVDTPQGPAGTLADYNEKMKPKIPYAHVPHIPVQIPHVTAVLNALKTAVTEPDSPRLLAMQSLYKSL
jgi:hypothetical protein